MSEEHDKYAPRLPESEAYREMLALALEQLRGDSHDLCRRLWISTKELEAYLSGAQPVPFAVFAGALDVVLDGMNSGRS